MWQHGARVTTSLSTSARLSHVLQEARALQRVVKTAECIIAAIAQPWKASTTHDALGKHGKS